MSRINQFSRNKIIKIRENPAQYKKSVRQYRDRIKSYSKNAKGYWLNNSKRGRECQEKGEDIKKHTEKEYCQDEPAKGQYVRNLF